VLDQLQLGLSAGRRSGSAGVEQGSSRPPSAAARVCSGAGQWAARVVARGGVRTSVEAGERVRLRAFLEVTPEFPIVYP